MTIVKLGTSLVVGAVVLIAGFVAAVLIDAAQDYAEDDDWQGLTDKKCEECT